MKRRCAESRIYGGNKPSYGVTECQDGWLEVRVYHDNQHVHRVLRRLRSDPKQLLGRNWKGLRAAVWLGEVIKDFRTYFEDGRVRIVVPSEKMTSTERRSVCEEAMSGSGEELPDMRMSPKDACARLHTLLEQLPLYGADVDLDLLPNSSGIYFFYQKTGAHWEPSGHGEPAKGIVRIGISGGARGRVSHHYHGIIPISSINLDTLCPKDRSIMRKHIGRAILNRPGHPHAQYLPIWNADLTTPATRDALRNRRNVEIEKAIEREVSDVMARDFYFRCVAGKSDEEVGYLETSAIGIVSSCPVCRRSAGWLGSSHPNPVISQGKLWNIKKVTAAYAGPLRLDLLARRIAESQ